MDDEGVLMSSRLADIQGNMDRVQRAGRQPGELAAYLELHIEQGPTLHQSGVPIGVVTGITGRWVYEADIVGVPNHAGTTPMSGRHDALVSASRLVLEVQRMASELEVCRVGTAGTIQAYPGAVNVVPGQVKVGFEFRDLDMACLAAADAEIRSVAASIAARDGVAIGHKPGSSPRYQRPFHQACRSWWPPRRSGPG